MKKRWKKILAIVLAALLGLVAIVAMGVEMIMTANAEDHPPRTRYELHVSLIDELSAARVEQNIHYTNQTGQQLDALLLRLYPNAFRRQNTAPFELEAIEGAYLSGFSPGGVDFFYLNVDGKSADWGVVGEDEAILRVNASLAPGQSCEIGLGFELLLPLCSGILGTTKLGDQLSGFYPMVLPWDEALKEFATFPISALGDNLFAEPADYSVILDVAEGSLVQSVGKLSKRAQSDGREQWSMEASAVRSMPIAISRLLRRFEDTPEKEIALTACMRDGGMANFALMTARNIATLYEKKLGSFPTDTLALVEAETPNGGESLSGMILLDPELLNWSRKDELEYELAFQLAKQFFSEAVGNNPQREPWLSEALPSYMALRYYKETYGQSRFLGELNERVLPALKMTVPGFLRVDSEVMQFQSSSDFDAELRLRGAAAMYEVSLASGEDAFLDALKLYIAQNRGKIASIADFANALNEATGRDLTLTLMEMLQNLSEYINPNTEWYE